MSTADQAWQEWSDANPDVHDGDTWPHRAFLAGYRRALVDAAENVDLSAHFDPSPSGRVSIACTDAERKVKVWLRDRAAGVGIDKQDACLSDGELASNSPTKDGDDDE